MKKKDNNADQREKDVQPIDSESIGSIVGGFDPFTELPKIKNQQIDENVTNNG